VEDADKLTEWLSTSVAETERRPERVRAALLARCRAEHLESPAPARVERMVARALYRAEEAQFSRVADRLPAPVAHRLRALITDIGATTDGGADVDDAPDGDRTGAGRARLGWLKSDVGAVGLEGMLDEVEMLLAVRSVGLPPDVFVDVDPRVLAGWRAQAMVETPSHLRAYPNLAKTLTLLAALVSCREREITDALVDVLIATVHRVGARAERKVTEELVNAFKRVTGKENILFAIAAVAAPDDPVRQVVFPAVSGGEATLRELVHEYKTKGPVYQRTVKTTLRASYTSYYRRGLIRLLEVLEFRSNNTAHRPVIDAVALIRRHAASGNRSYYPPGEDVPVHPGVAGDWEPLVWRTDAQGRQRVVRMAYEIATLQALRERLRCKEIWVEGAGRWCNPDLDLPLDFDDHRAEHYRELRKPLDPTAFISQVRSEMYAELDALEQALPAVDWLQITDRRSGAITLSPLDAAPEPGNLRRLKAEVSRRWGAVPLMDMLKEAVLRTGCLAAISALTSRGGIGPDDLAERLMLVIYAYGTNTGIRSVAAGIATATSRALCAVR